MDIQSFLESLDFDNDDFENYSDFFRVRRVLDEKPPGNDDCEVLFTRSSDFDCNIYNIFVGKANRSGYVFSIDGDTLVDYFDYWTPINNNPILKWHDISESLPESGMNIICEIMSGGNYKYARSFYDPAYGFVHLKGANVKSWCYIPYLRKEFESYESE